MGRGDSAKKAPPGDRFDKPPGEMSSVRDKLGYHAEDHAVPFTGGAVLVTYPGMGSSNPLSPFLERTR